MAVNSRLSQTKGNQKTKDKIPPDEAAWQAPLSESYLVLSATARQVLKD